MPKSRINYQVLALYAGNSPATTGMFLSGNSGTNLINQLERIQSSNEGFSVNRVDIAQFGELAPIDRVILEPGMASLSFDYILASLYNERILGFVTNGSCGCLSGILNKTADERNYFLKISPEGVDAVGDTTNNSNVAVIGIGNGFINNYSFQASVGGFPTVSVGVEGRNLTIQSTISGTSPAVDPSNGLRYTQFNYGLPTAVSSPGTGDLDISALRPGDITITLKQRDAEDEGIVSDPGDPFALPGASITDAKIQSVNMSFGLSREVIQALGTRYDKSREITFPVSVDCSIEAIVGDLTTGSLSDLVSCDKSYDIQVDLRKPNDCNPNITQPILAQFKLKNAKFNSQSFNHGIGSNTTVSLNFGGQIGSASQQTIGLFMSGLSS